MYTVQQMLLCYYFYRNIKTKSFQQNKQKGRKTLNNTKGDVGDTECNTQQMPGGHICLAWIIPFQHDQAYQCCKPREHYTIKVKKINYYQTLRNLLYITMSRTSHPHEELYTRNLTLINMHNFTFKINNDICNETPIAIVTIVHTAAQNKKARDIIR